MSAGPAGSSRQSKEWEIKQPARQRCLVLIRWCKIKNSPNSWWEDNLIILFHTTHKYTRVILFNTSNQIFLPWVPCWLLWSTFQILLGFFCIYLFALSTQNSSLRFNMIALINMYNQNWLTFKVIEYFVFSLPLYFFGILPSDMALFTPPINPY